MRGPRLSQLLLLLTVWLSIFPACTMWREHANVNTWSQVTGGESLERSFWHDVQSKNWNELERHIAANYIATVPEGRLDRSAALLRLQKFQLDDCSLGDFQVELSSGTLIVAYTLTLHGSFAGQPISTAPLHMLGVWEHQKSGWITIAHSVTESHT